MIADRPCDRDTDVAVAGMRARDVPPAQARYALKSLTNQPYSAMARSVL